MGVPVVIGGDNLPSPVEIGLTDLPNIGGASGPPGPPSSGITAGYINPTSVLVRERVPLKTHVYLT